jgi:hypothetical protein
MSYASPSGDNLVDEISRCACYRYDKIIPVWHKARRVVQQTAMGKSPMRLAANGKTPMTICKKAQPGGSGKILVTTQDRATVDRGAGTPAHRFTRYVPDASLAKLCRHSLHASEHSRSAASERSELRGAEFA